MCDLGGWDGALQISGLALSDLIVALDQSVQPTVDSYPSGAPSVFGGYTTNAAEQLLNQELLVPRVLYATWNGDFDAGPARYPDANDDMERLHARLREYVRLTDTEVVGGQSPRLQVLGDPGNRLTFVRNGWFNATTAPLAFVLQPANDPFVQPNTVRFRMSGKVLIGDNFVDGATVLASPDAKDFSMDLDYVVRVSRGSFFPLDLLNVGLGSLPFTTLPAPCAGPLFQRLPPLAGQPVWAQNLGTPCQNNPPGTPVGVQWRLTFQPDITNNTATLFTGAPGDCIQDPFTGEERWLVVDAFREPVSFQDPPDLEDGLQSLPRRLLVDKTCNGIAAEAGKSFAVLSFDKIASLSIVGGIALTVAQLNAINHSIMKLDGFLVGAWMDAEVQAACQNLNLPNCPPPPSPQQLAVLALLGPQAMNVAPLPGDLTLPFLPRRVTGDGVPYVTSDVILLHDAATKVFPPAGGDSGAIALGVCFADFIPPEDPLPENFTHAPNAVNAGQDIAVGLSQRVVDRWFTPNLIAPTFRAQLAQDVDGFDPGAFRIDVALAQGRFDVHVEGAGAFDLEIIDVPFDFAFDFPLRLSPRPAVARLNSPGNAFDGMPVDAAGIPLPADLSCIGLDLARGDFLASTFSSNPLCFLGYHDPRVPGANLLFQPGGPWAQVGANGCFSCSLGTPLCPGGTAVPTSFLWREGHFSVPPFPCPFGTCVGSVRPGLEIALVPPRRQEVEVEVDFAWWADLIVGLVAGPMVGLSPLNALALSGALTDMMAVDRIYSGLRGGVAGQTPLMPNFTLGWQFFLQHSNPSGPSNDAVTLAPTGMCMLFRVLIGPDPRLGNWAATVADNFGFQ